jgi:hypothetical protein
MADVDKWLIASPPIKKFPDANGIDNIAWANVFTFKLEFVHYGRVLRDWLAVGPIRRLKFKNSNVDRLIGRVKRPVSMVHMDQASSAILVIKANVERAIQKRLNYVSDSHKVHAPWLSGGNNETCPPRAYFVLGTHMCGSKEYDALSIIINQAHQNTPILLTDSGAENIVHVCSVEVLNLAAFEVAAS